MTVYIVAISLRDGYMSESAGLLPVRQLPIVAAGYGVFAVWFAKIACEAIYSSIRCQRLVFFAPKRHRHPESTTSAWRTCGVVRLYRAWCALFREGGPLEVTPETFELLFLLREIVEVTTQSYQAYKCSLLISQPWINNFYVGTLAVNCWAAPMIPWRSSHHPAMQRFLYLSSDVLLDLTATLVVPLSIIVSLVLGILVDNAALASGDMEYAFDVPYDDVFFVNLIKATRQVFVVTWVDFFAKMFPLLSMATCLDQIKQQVRRSSSSSYSGGGTRRVAILPPQTTQSTKREPSRAHTRSLLSSKLEAYRVKAAVTAQRVCGRAGRTHALLRLGLGDHGIPPRGQHYQPRIHWYGHGCKASSQPWFVSKFSCTMLEINCYRRGYNGDAAEIADALDQVDAGGVTFLLLSHCPRLYVPQELQALRHLLMLELSNSTIVEWTENATLVNSAHTELQFLNLNRVNYTTGELPEGLMSPQFSSRLRDITLAVSNITTLPHGLHTKWTWLLNLYIERTTWASLPSTVGAMKADRLSLLGNPIRSIADDFFATDATFQVFSVARTHLTQWPAQIGKLDKLFLLLMDYTAIDALPSWLIKEANRREREGHSRPITVSAGGSAFCDKHNGQPEKINGIVVVCRRNQDQEIEACPLTFMQQTRKP